MTIAKPEYRVSNDRWTVCWEDIGEGYDGNYNPDNPKDAPLFRIYVEDADGNHVENCSYCTLAIVGKATEDDLTRLSNLLFTALDKEDRKHAVQRWTWCTEIK